MSLFSLADELLLQILIATPQSLSTVLTCRRLHPVAVDALHTHPQVKSLSAIRKLMRRLHLHPELALKVLSLAVDFESGPGEFPGAKVWWLARPPILPNCTTLFIEPCMNSELMDEAPALPIEELLCWLVNCPRLDKLRIGYCLSSVSSSWRKDTFVNDTHLPLSLADIGVQLPQTLIHCELVDCIVEEDYYPQFWKLFDWAEHLIIGLQINDPTELWFYGFRALAPSLKRLSFYGFELASDLAGDLGHFPLLERLDCIIAPMTYEVQLAALQILNARLIPSSESIGETLQDLQQGLEDGLFPSLSSLKLKTSDVTLTAAVEELGLDALCSEMGIALTLCVTTACDFSDRDADCL